MKSLRTLLYLTAAVISAGVFFYAMHIDNALICLVSKPIPVLALALLLKPDNRYRQYIMAGLLLSVVGDIFLTQYIDNFILGLASFFLAHIAYIAAFTTLSRNKALLAAVLSYSIGILMYAFLYPMLGELKIPVLLYILVILTMVWRSFAQQNTTWASKLAIIGAILFALSDSAIALNKFYTPLPYAQQFIMLSYWSAQALIFASAVNRKIETKSS